MELLLLGLFGAVYYSFAVFSTGYFVSFVLFYLLCIVVLNSKINIKSNNDLFSVFYKICKFLFFFVRNRLLFLKVENLY